MADKLYYFCGWGLVATAIAALYLVLSGHHLYVG